MEVDKDSMKQHLIYQFEKDDLLFEVFELMNPTQLSFRLKVYENATFNMLTSAEIGENDLTEELQKDKRSYLLGPQKREDLAKYLISNSFFDEQKNQIQFLRSNLVEDF